MKKRIISLLMALALCLSLLPVSALATEQNNDWAKLGQALNSTIAETQTNLFEINGDTIKLLTDFKAADGDTTLTVNGTKTLDLGGHVINGNGKVGSVITVNGNLTLEDSNPNEKHTFKENATGLWVLDGNEGTEHTVTGGVITGGTGTESETEFLGGGVYIPQGGGTLTMTGGTIAGCTATKGGGVFTRGTMTMNNKSAIVGCTATIDGGGVCACNCAFSMTGDSVVSDCVAYNGGGGVYTWAGSGGTARFTMNGNSVIRDCKASANYETNKRSGGGVCVEGTGCTFTMTGGTITGNKATGDLGGGGVAFESGTVTLGGTAKITGNTKSDGTTNNLYLTGGKTITIGTSNDKPTTMSVGVTTATAPTDSNPVAITPNGTDDDAKYFFSDNTDYYVKHNNSALELAKTASGDKYQVWVGNTQVTAHNCTDVLNDGGKVSYNNATHTLTLNGATIAMSGQATGFVYGNASGVKSELDNLIVSIKGTNKIGAYSGTDMATENSEGLEANIKKFTVDAGVFCRSGNVSFVAEEDSSLTIIDYGAGIQAKDVTFGSDFKGTLKVLDLGGSEPQPCAISATGDVTINGGTFDLVSYNSNGIAARTVTINDCEEIKVKGLDKNWCYSINADTTLKIADTLEVKNAKNAANGNAYAAGATQLMSADGKGYVVIQPKPAPQPTPSGGGSSTPTVNVPVSGDKDSVKVTATVSGGNATVKNVTAEQLDKVGTGENVTIDLSSLSKSVSGVTIPKTTFENVAASEADGLEVKLPNGTTAVFDSATVAAVAEQAAGSSIQLVVDKEAKAEQALNAAQKETVKELNDALVLDAYFVSNGKRISDFKGGEAELTVSYPTTKPVRVWYVAEDGTKELVPSTFDGKAAKFVVTHFSHYAIEILDGSSYTSCPQDATCPMAAFGDLNLSAWYHDGVHYCLDNGLMNGVADTQFAPSGTLTRGMVVTVLARLNGVEAGAGNEWYVPGQKWAMENSISDGTNMTANITREELATMLYRYALLKKVDVDEITKDTNTLSHNDVFTISDWATSGMHFCIAAGVVNGDDNGNLNPHNTATRAEAATMFQRFCEKVIK